MPSDSAAPGVSGETTPDLAIVDDKLSGYLLNLDHPDGGPKAAFFLARGFGLDPIEAFVSALFQHGRPAHLISDTVTEFGVKSVFESPMPMPDGSTWRIRSVRFKAADDVRRLLVTAYPF